MSIKDNPNAVEFMTDKGVTVSAIDTDQMREVDRIAMEETGPNLYQMMENAGRNLATLSIDILGDRWNDANILVMAGLGGNGGGGITAARHLANRNARVTLSLSSPDRLGEVPSFQYEIFKSTSGRVLDLEDIADEDVDLIIDALIGYNLKGAPRGRILDFVEWANKSNAPVLSLDIPSGVDSTTGETPGEFVNANWTMTLAFPKTGLSAQKTGELYLADIGIPVETYNRINIDYTYPFDSRYVVPLIRK